MSIEINMPDIDHDLVEVTEIMVTIGDIVDVEQHLITVESEKASMEIPSPQIGIVKEIKIGVGDKVAAGQLIMIFDEFTKKDKEETLVSARTHSNLQLKNEKDNKDTYEIKSDLELKEVILPDIGYDFVEVIDVMVNIGDKVSIEQSLLTVEGEKASMEIPAPFAGEVKSIKITRGDKIKTGSLLMIFIVDKIKFMQSKVMDSSSLIDKKSLISCSKDFQDDSFITKKNNISDNMYKFIENEVYVHATPIIRRLAREFRINLANIVGTGRKGRILREDVIIYIREMIRIAENKQSIRGFKGFLSYSKTDFSKFGEIEEVDIGRIQKISSSNLSNNWISIPHVTIMENADITEVESFRNQQNKEIEKLQNGIKITQLVFVMKAVSRVLEEMPKFNSSISDNTEKLILKKYINIGIAVNTHNGLVVPVIRDVNKKGIITLSKQLIELSQKARSGKLTSFEMQGGSFTISNLGNVGTTNFTPIINAPEVAIIGLSRSVIKPIWNGSEFISRLILPMSLSFDHRVIDGIDAARFMIRISQLMSDVRLLIM
ncbi:Dihydrolipoyllysine-residue acetyltransferase component of pyruvate dehydrogenase complex [Candidatus Arsenophonus lipoptenae]|uniref:Dihydrolipoamide acetyltransferase component of pyruvate dehydrogenase complex n=1 Tax=Candidatus Arsenophonus lipoptenae TaxID=634113 RepID=A0A120HPT5_9GAMM|nr:2-oxo acid dehydrogenase subunit E2 [Candidatus Arsenophonus lipoptenae]AMA64740.1 Dihydrolipoyllysine-residue acetyltransferase component of pyruvate dehydrogenase complex [Candidatus Arsenophonus lipoptenae]